MRAKTLLLAALLAATAGCKKKAEAPKPRPAVISLYLDTVHVAEVTVGKDGALKLAAASDTQSADKLDAAFTAIRAKGALPLLDDEPSEAGQALGGEEVAPTDARYPYAVAAFLRQKTGLKYQVKPAKD